MSEFSNQVTNVLDGTLVPKMKDLVSSIALIEPYSVDSDELRARYSELAYLTLVYDYLHEYEVGNEEVDPNRLQGIIRLAGNIKINLQPEVFEPTSNTQLNEDLFSMKINGVAYTPGGPIPAGTNNIEVTYNGECDVTKLIYRQKMVGAPGQTVYMQNAVFDTPGDMEFRAYGNNNILLTSAKITFGIGQLQAQVYNALPTLGIPIILEV